MFSESGIMGGVSLSWVRLLRVLEFENLLFGLGIDHLDKNSIKKKKHREDKERRSHLWYTSQHFIIKYFINVTFKQKILYTDAIIVKQKLKRLMC